MYKGWIGVDLDGTLAHYDGWKGENHIGDPIPIMVKRIKNWLSEGKNVKIFTARAYVPNKFLAEDESIAPGAGINPAIKAIENWCAKHIGVVLPITCTKDYAMIELWDDRAVQVVPNTGYSLKESYDMALHREDFNSPICPSCMSCGCWMCEEIK